MFSLELLRERKALLRWSARRAAHTLLATTALSVIFPQIVAAQTPAAAVSAKRSYNIPRQSLDSALAAFSRIAGVQVLNKGAVTQGVTSPGVSGSFTSQEALSRLLAGTSLTPRFVGANTVTVTGPAAASGAAVNVAGAIQLDTVDVSGGRASAAEAPYSTPAPVAHISEQTIDRFRGSSPADIFRGTPGVMSGEARNGAGGIDVNIRGMQGMGRVAVTVDGAENGVTIYQGYQGISNRTFVDPDLLAGIDITKGSDASSRGIAGTVAMRTLEAGDVVKSGEKFGFQFKTGFGTNTAVPQSGAGAMNGYAWPYSPNPVIPPNVPIASNTGMNRPNFLDPTSGSGSAVVAWKDEYFDLLAGVAHRKRGNYYAGKNGPAAQPVDVGSRPYCPSPTWCHPTERWTNYYENAGLANYRAGEEVLNTQLDTTSYLAKATIRSDNGQSLQAGYNGFRSEAGDIMASRFTSEQGQWMQSEQTAGTKVDTGTLRYKWKPDDNDLVDLKANLWMTHLELRNPRRGASTITPQDLGLPWDYRTGSNTDMWGGDISNKSAFSLDQYGSLALTYGLSYLKEATAPSKYSQILEGWLNLRNGNRDESAAFAKVAYKPVEWLTLNGGLRYQSFRSQDLGNAPLYPNPKPNRSADGYSPSAGVTVEPVKGVQFYANYSNALRMPTLFESVSAFTLTVNSALKPERSSNWEAGVNIMRDGVFTGNDKGMLKFGYFNWNVKDYVAREWSGSTMNIHNIDRARFEGLEFSSRYEVNGFSAELAANYYLNVEFCQTDATCANKTLYGDYATNQVPPEYSANLTLSQKLLADALTVGGRVSYTGPRAAGHGAVTVTGASEFISLINWKPYWLVDVFADYKLTDDLTAWARIENLTDAYYVDPLGLVNQPGPGRTFLLGMTGKFGGSSLSQPFRIPEFYNATGVTYSASWTGFYLGGNAGYDFARFRGTAAAIDNTITGYPNPGREAPHLNLDGYSFGVQAGFNYQFKNGIVAGVEADISRPQISGYQNTLASEVSNLSVGQLESRLNSKIDWISTVRGRLGYALNDKLMLYATGGAAFLKETVSRDQYIADQASFTPNSTSLSFSENATVNRFGWVAGGGAEYAINDRWSLKADFLLAMFGQKEATFSGARAGVIRDVTTTTSVMTDPGTPGEWHFEAPGCTPLTLPIPPQCFTAGTPPIWETTTTTTQGSHGKSIGRKILSSIQIPMIKIGLNYKF